MKPPLRRNLHKKKSAKCRKEMIKGIKFQTKTEEVLFMKRMKGGRIKRETDREI